jgi:L-asparaginase
MRGAVSRPAYVSSHILRGLGVIAGHDLTPEAAVTKLAYVRSLGREFPDLAKQMSTDFAGEITARPS